MCSVESLCGPRGGPGIGSDLCVILVFNQHFQGEDWGSKIYSELFALVHPAWLLELAPFQGFRGLEMGACVLEGNAVRALD